MSTDIVDLNPNSITFAVIAFVLFVGTVYVMNLVLAPSEAVDRVIKTALYTFAVLASVLISSLLTLALTAVPAMIPAMAGVHESGQKHKTVSAVDPLSALTEVDGLHLHINGLNYTLPDDTTVRLSEKQKPGTMGVSWPDCAVRNTVMYSSCTAKLENAERAILTLPAGTELPDWLADKQ